MWTFHLLFFFHNILQSVPGDIQLPHPPARGWPRCSLSWKVLWSVVKHFTKMFTTSYQEKSFSWYKHPLTLIFLHTLLAQLSTNRSCLGFRPPNTAQLQPWSRSSKSSFSRSNSKYFSILTCIHKTVLSFYSIQRTSPIFRGAMHFWGYSCNFSFYNL